MALSIIQQIQCFVNSCPQPTIQEGPVEREVNELGVTASFTPLGKQEHDSGAGGNVKASVCIIAYNVEAFIAQALDTALAQRTNFAFEVVVGEDLSQDSTREIIADYHRRYPNLMRPIFREKNLGMVRNFAETVRACRGRYIAMLDGDDFWNSPLKLQKQVDFLDSHPECSGCYHNVNILYEADPGLTRRYYSRPPKPFLYLKDLVGANPICSGSMVFRAGLFKDFPEWYYTMLMQDWPLYLLNAQFGPAGYIDEVLSTYRIHPQSDWAKLDRIDTLERRIFAVQKMHAALNLSYDDIVQKEIANLQYKIAKQLFAQKDYEGARRHSRDAMRKLAGFRYLKALRVYLQSVLLSRKQPTNS